MQGKSLEWHSGALKMPFYIWCDSLSHKHPLILIPFAVELIYRSAGSFIAQCVYPFTPHPLIMRTFLSLSSWSRPLRGYSLSSRPLECSKLDSQRTSIISFSLRKLVRTTTGTYMYMYLHVHRTCVHVLTCTLHVHVFARTGMAWVKAFYTCS
jgi:hypothetical protein